jgi:DNA-binding NtrC family response regulator
MARRRGALARAVEHADRSAHADRTPAGQIAAGILLATCWTDDERFAEAAASLRSLVQGAEGIGAASLRARCLLALGRVRWREAAGGETLVLVSELLVSPDGEVACEAQLLRGRALLQAGDTPAAVSTARDGLSRAAGCGQLRLRAAAHRLMADALAAAGDLDGVRLHVREGLQLAARGRLPLALVQLRATLLRAIRTVTGDTPEAAELSAALGRTQRHPLPRVVRRAIEEARRGGVSAATGPPGCLGGPHAARLEALLDLAHRADDDRAAVTAVLARLCDQVGASSGVVVSADRRVLLTTGRPWRERPVAAEQALAAGRAVPADAVRLPPEAGEPVRCGGDIIAAIGCRWPLGTTVSAAATGMLRAASLAMATHVRGLAELAPPEAPPAVWSDLLGDSPAAAAMRESIVRASRAPFPVLIEGESGSGKELVARAIHRIGPRHARRFCAINCAALTDELVEAELFGHARGAFTGAATERAGLFEEADDGTLFLDEVGELSARAQAKLLRVIQEGEVRRVGENVPRRVDVRIVAATNRHLEHEAAAGRFRTDLRFRLDVLRIVVPPLRERACDIPVLAQHFWRLACARIGSQALLGADTVAALCRYEWPGNVRELQNTIARMAVYAPRRGRVPAAAVPAHLASSPMATGSFDAAREEFERRYVRAALAQAGGHQQAAARALGISRQGLAKMLRRLGIDRTPGNGPL